MHAAAFARAAVPTPSIILKLPLRPYSVGHALWLEEENNPLAGDTEGRKVQARHIIEAVWICSSTWRELQAMHAERLALVKHWIWRRRARREDLAVAVVDFQNYRRNGSTFPPAESLEGGGRVAGSPVLARVIQFLIQRMGQTEAQAMDYPLGLAYWHFAVHQETEGGLKILNAGEMEFEAWCQQQDEAAEIQRRDPPSSDYGAASAKSAETQGPIANRQSPIANTAERLDSKGGARA